MKYSQSEKKPSITTRRSARAAVVNSKGKFSKHHSSSEEEEELEYEAEEEVRPRTTRLSARVKPIQKKRRW